MDLFGKIFGLQTVQKDEQELESLTENNEENKTKKSVNGQETVVAILNLMLCSDGSLQIACDWTEQSSNMAKIYGKFLYHVVNGDIEKFIIKQLELYTNNNIVSRSFVEEIVATLKEHQDDNTEQAVITPSNALKLSNLVKEELQ